MSWPARRTRSGRANSSSNWIPFKVTLDQSSGKSTLVHMFISGSVTVIRTMPLSVFCGICSFIVRLFVLTFFAYDPPHSLIMHDLFALHHALRVFFVHNLASTVYGLYSSTLRLMFS